MKKYKLTIPLFLLITSGVHAEIYQWTDKKGNVHFSDKPIINSNSKKLTLKESNKMKSIKTKTTSPAKTNTTKTQGSLRSLA
jgi:uncharacterized protein DUF4124